MQRTEIYDRLQSQAWLIARSATPLLVEDKTVTIEDLAKDTARQTGARVTIANDSGVVLGDSEANPATLPKHAGRPEIAAALHGSIGHSERLSQTVHKTLIYIAVPILDGPRVIGAARVALPADQFASYRRHIILAVGLALLIAAIALTLLAAAFSRLVSRPLQRLVATARSVAAGNLDSKAEEQGSDEFAELAVAFNEMTGELRGTIQSMANERARLNSVIEHLSDGLIIVDDAGEIALINVAAETLLGVTHARLLGEPFAGSLHDAELVELVRSLESAGDQRFRQSGGNANREMLARFVELGQPRRSIQAVAYRLPHPKTPVALILRDITELRRTESIRRDVVAKVSHELRTPIASLKALVETLRDGAIEDEMVAQDFLARMETEVDGLASLVQDLLVLSRAESGRLALDLHPDDLAVVIESAIERLRAQAEPKQVELVAEIADDLPPGTFDAVRIEQVLVNLLHNAIKYSPERGKVTVSAGEFGQELRVSVADAGPGIDETDLERIFERFYKADRSRSQAGSGLGLAISRHLIALHGGRIWAESPGHHGAIVSFTVPLAAGDTLPLVFDESVEATPRSPIER